VDSSWTCRLEETETSLCRRQLQNDHVWIVDHTWREENGTRKLDGEEKEKEKVILREDALFKGISIAYDHFSWRWTAKERRLDERASDNAAGSS
jgi:hypothetical protein